MEEHRHNIRVDCAEKCVLHFSDWPCLATVKNISFGGALVHSSIHTLKVGDDCRVTMDGGSLREYSCKVVRVKSADIALMFTGMQRMTTPVGQ